MLAFIWIHIYNVCTQLCAWIYIALLYSVDYIKLYCHIRYELRTSSECPFGLQKKKYFYQCTVSILPLQTDQTGQSPAGWAPTDRQTPDKEHSSSKWAPLPSNRNTHSVVWNNRGTCSWQIGQTAPNIQKGDPIWPAQWLTRQPHWSRVHPKFGSLWR